MYQGWMNERSRFNQIEAASDFLSYLSADVAGFVTTASDGGSVAAGDTENGVVVLSPSDTTVGDNDETYMHTNKVFKMGLDRPSYAAARISTTVASAAADHNFIFGWCSAAVANSLQDNGAGPPADYYGALFFKADGAASVFFEVSAGSGDSVKTTSAALALASGTLAIANDTYHVYEIVGEPNLSTDFRYWFLIDGQPVGTDAQKSDGVTVDPTSAVVMRGILGIKLGAATNHDKLNVDWAVFKQLKA